MLKKIDDMNYYELLEVSYRATAQEIHKAYERVRKIYDPNSIALYSLFSPEETEKIRQRVEDAYRTLIYDENRRDYDRTLRDIPACPGAAAARTALPAPPLHLAVAYAQNGGAHGLRSGTPRRGASAQPAPAPPPMPDNAPGRPRGHHRVHRLGPQDDAGAARPQRPERGGHHQAERTVYRRRSKRKTIRSSLPAPTSADSCPLRQGHRLRTRPHRERLHEALRRGDESAEEVREADKVRGLGPD